MIIRVEKHTDRYTVIDNSGLNDPRLGLKARGLLGYLLTKPDNWEITVQGIIAQVPDGRDAVQAALKELETLGYAQYVTVRAERGRLGGKKWVIFERPATENQQVTEEMPFHRQTGFPIIGKTDYRKNRLSEKPQQVSTIYGVNTIDEASTEDVRRAKKIRLKPSEKPAPPIPAPPPVRFSESGWQNDDSWRCALIDAGAPDSVDSHYYYRRCQTWSNGGRVSADWPAFAAFIAKDDDFKRTKKTNHATNNPSATRADGLTARAVARTERLLRGSVG